MRAVLTGQETTWRISSGSAAALGIRPMVMDAAPTTAYLMLGERCINDCAFCTQARSSHAHADALARVAWPQVDPARAADAIAQGYEQGAVRRVCFQVTGSPDDMQSAKIVVNRIAESCAVPICVSIAVSSMAQIEALLAAGAERVTLALDAVTPDLYARIKGRDWQGAWSLLTQAARAFPGHIGTHLIVGLGEREDEFVARAASLLERGITIGVFAFTPVRGTRLEHAAPPAIESYRRIQAAFWLLKQGNVQAADLRFDTDGRLCGVSLDRRALIQTLGDGDAFRTAGCPDCNRPYYNERPGSRLYNYPRPLTRAEAEYELSSLVQSLDI